MTEDFESFLALPAQDRRDVFEVTAGRLEPAGSILPGVTP